MQIGSAAPSVQQGGFIEGMQAFAKQRASNIANNLKDAYNNPLKFAGNLLINAGKGTIFLASFPVALVAAENEAQDALGGSDVSFRHSAIIGAYMRYGANTRTTTATVRQLNANETVSEELPGFGNCNPGVVDEFSIARGDGSSGAPVTWRQEGREMTAYIGPDYNGRKVCTSLLNYRPSPECQVTNKQVLCVKGEDQPVLLAGVGAAALYAGGAVLAGGILVKAGLCIKGESAQAHQKVPQVDQV